MEAEKKFQGATYHLDKMSQLYLKNEEHFTYELDSFLSKIRSVPDVMLEDFNEKYKLGISLGENLYPDDFEMRAKKLGNKDALDFIKWWKKEIGKLWSSSSGPLLTKRNISIHRKVITADLKKMIATNKITAYATIAVYDKNGKLVSESSTKKQEEEKPIPVRIEWSFKDYPNDNALDLCKTLHAEIQSMLNEAKFFYCK